MIKPRGSSKPSQKSPGMPTQTVSSSTAPSQARAPQQMPKQQASRRLSESSRVGQSQQQKSQINQDPSSSVPLIFHGTSIMPKPISHNPTHKPTQQVEKQPISDIIIRNPSKQRIPTLHTTKMLSDTKPQIRLIPAFSELSVSEHHNNFLAKLEQCCVVCDWSAEPTPSQLLDRDTKTRYLKDIVSYITTGKNVFPESCWGAILKMVSANIFRPLLTIEKPPVLASEMDEEEPQQDPAWQHLQFVYEILFRFVLSNEVDPKVAIKYFTTDFISSIIDLFDSDDPRERDGLKSTLHRIYSRFWPRRPFIRTAISHKFHRLIDDQIPFNGIAELLEILGSIIHGFGVPVKQEHRLFLQHTLLPLHKAPRIATFHMQLSNCMILFIEKEPQLSRLIISSLIHFWPKTNSPKQILFLAEMEDILDSLSLEDLHPLTPILFKKIAECIQSPHFQVAERALSLLSNEYILQLISQTRQSTIPVLFMALYTNTKQHWNNSVISLTFSALKLLMEMDSKLFSQCATSFKKKNEMEHTQRVTRDAKWEVAERIAKRRREEGGSGGGASGANAVAFGASGERGERGDRLNGSMNWARSARDGRGEEREMNSAADTIGMSAQSVRAAAVAMKEKEREERAAREDAAGDGMGKADALQYANKEKEGTSLINPSHPALSSNLGMPSLGSASSLSAGGSQINPSASSNMLASSPSPSPASSPSSSLSSLTQVNPSPTSSLTSIGSSNANAGEISRRNLMPSSSAAPNTLHPSQSSSTPPTFSRLTLRSASSSSASSISSTSLQSSSSIPSTSSSSSQLSSSSSPSSSSSSSTSSLQSSNPSLTRIRSNRQGSPSSPPYSLSERYADSSHRTSSTSPLSAMSSTSQSANASSSASAQPSSLSHSSVSMNASFSASSNPSASSSNSSNSSSAIASSAAHHHHHHHHSPITSSSSSSSSSSSHSPSPASHAGGINPGGSNAASNTAGMPSTAYTTAPLSSMPSSASASGFMPSSMAPSFIRHSSSPASTYSMATAPISVTQTSSPRTSYNKSTSSLGSSSSSSLTSSSGGGGAIPLSHSFSSTRPSSGPSTRPPHSSSSFLGSGAGGGGAGYGGGRSTGMSYSQSAQSGSSIPSSSSSSSSSSSTSNSTSASSRGVRTIGRK